MLITDPVLSYSYVQATQRPNFVMSLLKCSESLLVEECMCLEEEI